MGDRQQKVRATSISRRLPSETHARFQFIGACKPCRLRSGCEDSIDQDWRSIPTEDLSRPLPKAASLVVKKVFRGIRWFTCFFVLHLVHRTCLGVDTFRCVRSVGFTTCSLEALGSIKHVGPTTSCGQKGGHVPGFVYHIVHVFLPTVSFLVSSSFHF